MNRTDIALLEKYLWKKRVLLVFAHSEQDGDYQAQVASLAKVQEELSDRDLVLCYIFTDKGQLIEEVQVKEFLIKAICEELRAEFSIGLGKFSVVLIGKDGGEKYRKSTNLLPQELFGVIDAMPMRKSEMQKRKH